MEGCLVFTTIRGKMRHPKASLLSLHSWLVETKRRQKNIMTLKDEAIGMYTTKYNTNNASGFKE